MIFLLIVVSFSNVCTYVDLTYKLANNQKQKCRNAFILKIKDKRNKHAIKWEEGKLQDCNPIFGL